MTSGIIYLAIIGMWVAYFVPRWVHSHEEFSGKSVERYKSALRVVATGSDTSINSSVSTDSDHEAKNAHTLIKRRIIFALLSASLVFTLLEFSLSTLAFEYNLLPLSGLAIYVAHVRRQSLVESLQRRRIVQLHRSTAGVSTTNLSQVVAPKQTREHWIPLSERELTGVVLLPQGSAQERDSWSPVNIPVPTYVSAPKAFVPKRVIDLTIPGAWSEEQEKLEREALAAAAPSADQVFDQQLAEQAVERFRDASNS